MASVEHERLRVGRGSLSGIPTRCHGDGVDPAHDYDGIWRRDGMTIWRAVYAYAGGRREVADDAVAEAISRTMAHSNEGANRWRTCTGSRFGSRARGAARTTKETADMPDVATAGDIRERPRICLQGPSRLSAFRPTADAQERRFAIGCRRELDRPVRARPAVA